MKHARKQLHDRLVRGAIDIPYCDACGGPVKPATISFGQSMPERETREAFASRVRASSPSFPKLTELHLAAHLRNPGLPREARPELEQATWRQMLREVRKELAQKLGFWRRLRGVLQQRFPRVQIAGVNEALAPVALQKDLSAAENVAGVVKRET
mgnify:CR=1 FL=1